MVLTVEAPEQPDTSILPTVKEHLGLAYDYVMRYDSRSWFEVRDTP